MLYYDIEYCGDILGVIINTSTKPKVFDIEKHFEVLHTLGKNGDSATLSNTNISMPPVSVSIIKYMA